MTVDLLRLPDVIRRTGLSRSSIYMRIKAGTFPRPVPLGSPYMVAWVSTEIDEWIAARIAERDGTEDGTHVDS